MPYGVEPEGSDPTFWYDRLSISFIEGCRMEYGAWVIGLMNTKPILPVTVLCSSKKTAPNEKETMMALHLLSVWWSARGDAHTAIHTFGRTVGNFDQVNGGPYRQIFELPRSNSTGYAVGKRNRAGARKLSVIHINC